MGNDTPSSADPASGARAREGGPLVVPDYENGWTAMIPRADVQGPGAAILAAVTVHPDVFGVPDDVRDDVDKRAQWADKHCIASEAGMFHFTEDTADRINELTGYDMDPGEFEYVFAEEKHKDEQYYIPTVDQCPAWPLKPDATDEERAKAMDMTTCGGRLSHVRFREDVTFTTPQLIPDDAPRFMVSRVYDQADFVIPEEALLYARRWHRDRA